MSREWLIGIDIGGTNLVVGLVPAEGGEAVGLRNRATDATRGGDAIVQDVVRMAREAVQDVVGPEDTVLALGVGSPGAVDRMTGVVTQSPNLGWTDFPLRERIEALADWPVFLDNDANCATFAEWWLGAGHGSSSLFGITVGTGIGGAYIVDGRILHGVTDGAGEIGHTTVNFVGRRCACGNYGCLEAYASGPNIAAMAREGIEAGTASALTDLVDGKLEAISAATVYEAVLLGDPFATHVLTEAARFLGVGIANVINLLNPEVVVVMGGVTQAGDHLFDPLRAEVRRRAFRVAANACRLVGAALRETAGVVGAAGIAAVGLGRLGPESNGSAP